MWGSFYASLLLCALLGPVWSGWQMDKLAEKKLCADAECDRKSSLRSPRSAEAGLALRCCQGSSDQGSAERASQVNGLEALAPSLQMSGALGQKTPAG